MYFITGDMHGDLTRIEDFCTRFKSMIKKDETTLIILGDVGLNYYRNKKDLLLKEYANGFGITLFLVKGNHEIHADQVDGYKQKMWNGAPVYYEEEFPNLLFAKDGEVYDIDNKKVLVIGGAYSVDKFNRLSRGLRWFSSEQPSEQVKRYVFAQLNRNKWEVDTVLTHTAPLKTEPIHLFLPMIDQSDVDKTTELFLDEISDKLKFEKWYFGHYHGNWRNGKYQLLFDDIVEFS